MDAKLQKYICRPQPTLFIREMTNVVRNFLPGELKEFGGSAGTEVCEICSRFRQHCTRASWLPAQARRLHSAFTKRIHS